MARHGCPGCGHAYDEQPGDAHESFPPGTPRAQVPDGWACADCAGRDTIDFVPVEPGG